MRKVYRFVKDWNKKEVDYLNNKGIIVKTGFCAIEFLSTCENDKLLPILKEWGASINQYYEFSKKEILAANNYLLGVKWPNGYPMPDNDFGYLNLTYNLDNYCDICGIGLVQKAPFRIRSEPKWENKKLFTLEWVYDEVFVKTDYYQEIFQPKGYGYWPVLKYKTESIIKDTVQLKIPFAKSNLKLDNFERETCPMCNRIRYELLGDKGFATGFMHNEDSDISKSLEYFGSGASSHHRIYVNKFLFEAFQNIRPKPLLHPCHPE